MSKELIEALKEAGRVVVLAVLPLAVDMVSRWVFDWRELLVVAILALLKFIDSYLHQVGTTSGNQALVTGLTRF